MLKITTTNKRGIASDLAQLLVKYQEHSALAMKFVRKMDECQKQHDIHGCLSCPQHNSCPHIHTMNALQHKENIITAHIALFMAQYAWFFMRVLDARYTDASELFRNLVEEERQLLGDIPAVVRTYLEEIGYPLKK